MKVRWAWPLLACLSATGCGKFLDQFARTHNQETRVKISAGGAAAGYQSRTPAVLSGGVMIYVKGNDGSRFTLSGADQSATFSIALPSDRSYTFTAYGWDTLNFAGTPRCGRTGPLPITGATASVSLTMSQAGCSDDTIAAAANRISGLGPLALTFQFCAAGTDLSGVTSANFGSFTCGGTPSDRFLWGDMASSISAGGYLSGPNAVAFTTTGASTKGFYWTDLGTGVQHKIRTISPSDHFHHLSVVPSTGAVTRTLFIADQTNTGVDDLYLRDFTTGVTTNLTNLAVATPVNVTGDVTSSSATLTGLSSTTGISVGDAVTGGGLPAGSYVSGVNSGTQTVTLVDATNAPVSPGGTSPGAALTFTPPQRMVKEYRVSPDGKYVVFVKNQGYEPPGVTPVIARYQLYSLDISGTSFGAPLAIGNTIPDFSEGVGRCDYMGSSTCGGSDNTFQFEISPIPSTASAIATPYVIYVSDQGTTGVFRVHVASLDGNGLFAGSSGSGDDIGSTSAPSAPGDYSDTIRFSYDATHVYFHAYASSQHSLYEIKISSGTAPVLSTVCAPGSCTTNRPYFAMGNVSNKLVYQTGVSYPALNLKDFDNSTSYPTAMQATASDTGYTELRFTPDDQYVISISHNGGNTNLIARWLKFSDQTSNTFNTVNQIYPVSPTDGTYLQLYKGGGTNYVAFRSDENRVGYPDLMGGIAGTPGMSFLSSSSASGAQSVNSFRVDTNTGNVYFAADYATGSFFEMYRTDVTGTTPVALNSGVAAGSINRFGGNQGGIMPGFVYFEAAPLAGGGNTEGYAFKLADSSFVRLSKLNATGSNTLGRVRVTLSGSVGGIPQNYSRCLMLSSVEGSVLTDYAPASPADIHIPLGDGSTGAPFATGIDVFPQATSCSGLSYHYELPNGLATFGTSSYPNQGKLIGDGSSLRLIIND